MPGAIEVVFAVNPSLWNKPMYSSGILCLSNYLTDRGISNLILDGQLAANSGDARRKEEILTAEIMRLNPRLVCFSSTHRDFAEVSRMNQRVRRQGPAIVTIVGGPQPSYRFSDYLDNGFDFACVGEGEKTLFEFAGEVLAETRQWERIDGLVYRAGPATRVNRPRELLSEQELSTGSFEAYKKIDPRHFDYSIEIIRGLPLRGGTLLTGRGCPYSCSFCGCNAIFGRRMRFRDLDHIDREIAVLKADHNVEGLWILDDTFTVNKKHAYGVAELLRKHDIIWGCQSRVDITDKEFFQKLKACGCVQVDFGVESGSQRILDDIIGKRTTSAQVANAFRLAREAGMRTLANFMIGLPSETTEDLQATTKIAKAIKADVYVFSIATPLPGTRLYEMVGEEISPFDYASLDWNGGVLTDRLNKSLIPDITKERRKLKNRYLLRSLRKACFRKDTLGFLLSKRDYRKRIGAIARFLRSQLSG